MEEYTKLSEQPNFYNEIKKFSLTGMPSVQDPNREYTFEADDTKLRESLKQDGKIEFTRTWEELFSPCPNEIRLIAIWNEVREKRRNKLASQIRKIQIAMERI